MTFRNWIDLQQTREFMSYYTVTFNKPSYKNSSGFVDDYYDFLIKIKRWCDDNIIHDWTWQGDSPHFSSKQDAIMFKLRWG